MLHLVLIETNDGSIAHSCIRQIEFLIEYFLKIEASAVYTIATIGKTN